MARTPDEAKKHALLAAATSHVLEHGMASLSLRPMAQALGTSPRMLLYHFGSKEQLVTDVLAVARERQAALTAAWVAKQPELGPADLLRRFWRWQVSEHQEFLRLFFEVYGLALQDPERFPGFPREGVVDWIPFVADALERAGVERKQSRTAATVVIAGYRGLLLDVLATGDRKRTARALDVFLDALDAYLSD